MKINLIKTANNKMWPVDEEAEMLLTKLKKGDVYVADIKVNHNYELHKKIMGFFAFCTRYYYGDMDAAKNKYKFDYVRGELTKIAGYVEQVPNRNGDIKIVPRSLAYESMLPEEKSDFYKRITDAALRAVFDKTTDQNILNQLMGWF